jgi:hypothetical protein
MKAPHMHTSFLLEKKKYVTLRVVHTYTYNHCQKMGKSTKTKNDFDIEENIAITARFYNDQYDDNCMHRNPT